MDGGQLLPNTFLHRQFQLTRRIIKLALLSQGLGVRRLSHGELIGIGGKHLLQIGQLALPAAKFVRDHLARSIGFDLGDFGLLGHVIIPKPSGDRRPVHGVVRDHHRRPVEGGP